MGLPVVLVRLLHNSSPPVVQSESTIISAICSRPQLFGYLIR